MLERDAEFAKAVDEIVAAISGSISKQLKPSLSRKKNASRDNEKEQ